MSDRLLLNRDHLVVSKSGFDATNPSLPEGDKLFDSNWLFSSSVVEVGLHLDQASYRNSKRSRGVGADETTDWSGQQYIDFTPLPFVPTVILIPLADPRYWPDHNMVLLGVDPVAMFGRFWPNDYWRNGEITITNSRITIPRCYSKGGKWHYRESFMYLIMAM